MVRATETMMMMTKMMMFEINVTDCLRRAEENFEETSSDAAASRSRHVCAPITPPAWKIQLDLPASEGSCTSKGKMELRAHCYDTSI